MCGIAGLYNFSDCVDPRLIGGMTRLMRHRGPDDEGYLFVNSRSGGAEERSGDDTISSLKGAYKPLEGEELPPSCDLVLGHRRLSVIDVSPAGHQPMSYNNGDYWITYNGEIFNYIELREELRHLGHPFKTQSDTEVVLASYAEWGADCVKHFNGDWAFCIYDRIHNLLLLSRDRYGVRPLYYIKNGGTFAFASEIKPLFTIPGVGTDVELKSFSQFLMLGLVDHTDRTMYQGISQLRPAHNLTLDLNTFGLTTAPYYTMTFCEELGVYDEVQARRMASDIYDLLYDSVRLRLRSDVPVGTCLSGGLDSSAIVMMINRLIRENGASAAQIGEHQKTFTASYADDPVDETGYAREIISKADVDAKFVSPDGGKLWSDFDGLLRTQDEPFGTTAVYAQWNVMDLASKHVTVVLDGQGGDELFGGYLAHFPFAIAQGNVKVLLERFKYSPVTAFKDLYLAMGIRLIPSQWKGKSFSLLRQKYFNHLASVMPQFPANSWNVEEIVSEVAKPNLNSRLHLDMRKYTIPQLLHYEDRNGMAFSVESRVPYLDFRLVDYVMNIPSIYKIYNGWSKWIFRLAIKEILPENILWRKDKIGFTTPEKKWLLNGPNSFTEFVRDQKIPYDGDVFWWRLFVGSHWVKNMAGEVAQ